MSISFQGAHDWLRAKEDLARQSSGGRAERSTEPNPSNLDPISGLRRMTLNELIESGKKFRFVDNPQVDYADLLSTEDTNINSSPFTQNSAPINWTANGGKAPRVAIIGGGMSGMMTAFQLAKTGMNVTIFEANGDPVIDKYNGAGRIKPTFLQNAGTDDGELGAMRFPNSSYLYWVYMKRIFATESSPSCNGDTKFTAFPNVGKVPTIFRGNAANQNIIQGVWPENTKGEKPDLPAYYKAIANKHNNAIYNYKPDGQNLTVTQVLAILSNKDASQTAENLLLVPKFWTYTLAALGTKNYRQFLTDIAGLTEEEVKVAGYIGAGTGGFAPLFKVSIVEILRLFIWDYSNEFSNPFQPSFPGVFNKKLTRLGVDIKYNSPVKGVGFYAFDAARGEPAYQILYKKSLEQLSYLTQTAEAFDYVVLGMTHVAAKELLQGSQAAFRSAGYDSFDFPFYDTKYPGYKSEIRGDLERQTGINAVKIFQKINGPYSLNGENVDKFVELWI